MAEKVVGATYERPRKPYIIKEEKSGNVILRAWFHSQEEMLELVVRIWDKDPTAPEDLGTYLGTLIIERDHPLPELTETEERLAQMHLELKEDEKEREETTLARFRAKK